MDYSKLWRISVYLTISIQCIAPSVAQDVDECSSRCWNPVLPNSNVLNGIKQDGVVIEEDCKALCVNNGTCIEIDWDKERNECWFHMKYGPIKDRPNVNHCSLANCTDDCVSYCWRPVKMYFGVSGGSHQSDITDENHCKLRCSNTSTCTGIDWNSHCWLIFTIDPPRPHAGVRHWDIERNLPTNCLTTGIPATTTTAKTTLRATTAHVKTTPPLETTTSKSTTTIILTSEASTSSAISSGTPSSPFTNSSNSSSSDPHKTNNTNAIIGGVVGGFCGLILIITLIVLMILFVRNGRILDKKSETENTKTDDNDYEGLQRADTNDRSVEALYTDLVKTDSNYDLKKE